MAHLDHTITLNATVTLNVNAANSDPILKQILKQLAALAQKEEHMAADLTALRAQVAAVKGVEDSGVALITGLAAKIQQLIDASGNTVDPAELQAIVDQMGTDAQPLAAAVAANPVP